MRVLLLFATSILLVSSCCKVGCVYQSMDLIFDSVSWEELDSVMIRKYEPGTNFTVMLDSVYRRSAVTGGDGAIFLDDGQGFLDLDKNYQIFVPISNKTYNITEIKTDRFKCPCEGKRGRKIVAYTLNNVLYTDWEIHLR